MFRAISIHTVRNGNYKISAVGRKGILVADIVVTPKGDVVDCTFKEGTKVYKAMHRTAINTLKEHGWLPY